MRPSVRLGLAAGLLAAAATPAVAQGYGSQGYGAQSGYAQPGSGSNSGYGSQPYPPSTYDRDPSGYPPSAQGRPSQDDQVRRPGDYGGAERYGQPERYDPNPSGGQADDPQAMARQLNLTPSQRASFDAYRRAFAPDEARQRQEEDEMQRMASLTTPQRLDAARAAQARDRADLDRTDAATRAFYGQLSPAQRRTFDQLTAPQMDDGGGQDGPSPTQPTARPQR